MSVRTITTLRSAVFVVVLSIIPRTTLAADGDAELAKKLSNPIASLISIPIQANYDENIGLDDKGDVWRINVQPVIPISLNKDWNVITRTIVPIIDQDDIPTPGMNASGIGDVLASQFFSPVAPTASGWIWGVGPAWLLPTATDDALGAEQWSAGPTFVALKQEHGWTYGVLTNHLWSFSGNSDRSDVDATYIQPFLTYTTPKALTVVLNTESTYDWEEEEWSVPVHLAVFQIFRFGKLPVQIGGGLRYWVESPPFGPEGFGLRFQVTALLPK